MPPCPWRRLLGTRQLQLHCSNVNSVRVEISLRPIRRRKRLLKYREKYIQSRHPFKVLHLLVNF